MSNHNDRKKMIDEYKQREVTGGIYRIVNTATGTASNIRMALDLKAIHSRLQFSRDMGECIEPELRQEWNEYGGKAFEIEELETLSKKQDQTSEEFKEELKLLFEMWKKNN